MPSQVPILLQAQAVQGLEVMRGSPGGEGETGREQVEQIISVVQGFCTSRQVCTRSILLWKPWVSHKAPQHTHCTFLYLYLTAHGTRS